MNVYRICTREEIQQILSLKGLSQSGAPFCDNKNTSTHKYAKNKKYLHFFESASSIFHLSTAKGRVICIYNIPQKLLNKKLGYGKYWDYITFAKLRNVKEYAIETDLLKFEYLNKAYLITKDIDFEDFYHDQSLNGFIEPIYTSQRITDNTPER